MRSLVVLSIADADRDGRRRLLAGETDGADVAEIRADRLRSDDVVEAIRRSPIPVIVTARAAGEGGGFDRDDAERLRIYRAALDAGAFAVDVEARSALAAKIGAAGDGLDPARVIASRHGDRAEAAVLRERFRELAALPAARLKLVPDASAVDDVVAVRDLLRAVESEGRRLACFATGDAGRTSRILAPSWGSWATYGSAGRGTETALGQVAVRDLVGVHDVRGIGPETRLFGLVGGRVGGSPSPAMHADLYRVRGIDARYLPIDTDDLDALERLRPHLPLEAIGVTAPHKEEAARRCAALEADARDAGAVNTVRFDGPWWSGSNTDASGLRRLLGARDDVAGARALVVGAGGTGRTAARVLLDAGAAVTLVNRTDGRARDVAAALGASVAPWAERASVEAEILVLAVPDGARDGSLRTSGPRRHRLVVDYAYGPRETDASAWARAAGVDVLDGLDLLAAQGADQFRVMTGAAPDEPRMRATAAAWLQQAG